MYELKNMKELLETALVQIEAFEGKKTKAASARIRAALGKVKNGVTDTRAALVTADKAGY